MIQEKQSTFASTTNSILHEENLPYQRVENQIAANDATKTPNHAGSHIENVPLNVNINLNSDRAHNTQPKVSFFFSVSPIQMKNKF